MDGLGSGIPVELEQEGKREREVWRRGSLRSGADASNTVTTGRLGLWSPC